MALWITLHSRYTKMFEDSQRIDIETLGEFGLIDFLTQALPYNRNSTIKGVGDDAAVLGEGKSKSLHSTEIFVEGVHFDLAFHPLKHLGYKGVVAAIADIYAMNGKAEQILVSLAFSNRFSLQAIEELYAGINQACAHYELDLVGGDTATSRQGLVISITAIGQVSEENLVYRKGAEENDLICVTGDLGSAYMGLQILEREKQVYLSNPQMQPDLDAYNYILQRQLKPEVPFKTLESLKKLGIKPSAMIDVSDGLASDLFQLCKSSACGAAIYELKIPIDPTTVSSAEELHLDPLTCALNGGEDYELLFTIKQKDFEAIRQLEEVSIIGHITRPSAGKVVITKNDNQFALRAQGWPEEEK